MQFDVDDDLAALIERLAKKKPFEHLSFNTALRRVLESFLAEMKPEETHNAFQGLLPKSAITAGKEPKKAPTPNPTLWASSVPELKAKSGLNTWKAICDELRIETAGDSARRKLKNWVKAHRPNWPAVPDID